MIRLSFEKQKTKSSTIYILRYICSMQISWKQHNNKSMLLKYRNIVTSKFWSVAWSHQGIPNKVFLVVLLICWYITYRTNTVISCKKKNNKKTSCHIILLMHASEGNMKINIYFHRKNHISRGKRHINWAFMQYIV